MEKHTPGPWTEKASLSKNTVTTKDSAHIPIAFCFSADYRVVKEANANARLIAKAPEMYELLKILKGYIEHASIEDEEIEKLIKEIEGE